MLWFTKDDVSKAADVFLNWFGRIAESTTNTLDDSVHAIIAGQKDNFVNLLAKVFNLNAMKAKANGFSAPAPKSHEELVEVMPGLTREEVAGLTDVQKEALATIAQIAAQKVE